MTDLAAWLEEKGLGQYAKLFEREKLTLDLLSRVTDADLRGLGIPLGHRLLILEGARAASATQIAGAVPNSPTNSKTSQEAADRRPLTVVFCDLADSIPVSRHFGPEEFRALLNTYRAACSSPLRRYGGYAARYVGDGILIYFGYPFAHENDAERALYASIEIRSAVAELDRESREKGGPKIGVHIGIATGEVVVGEIGGGEAAEEAAVTGEAPNLAARLQSLAPTGSIYIDQMTRDLVGEQFEYVSLGEKHLKGFDRPVAVWDIVGERPFTRFESHSGITARLVGREPQIAALAKQWHLAVSGSGQIAVISGRAGMGKSRLAEAVRAQAVDAARRGLSPAPSVIRLQCSQMHTNTPFYPVARAIERLAGIDRTDDSGLRLAKLGRLLDQSKFTGSGSARPLLAELIGAGAAINPLPASMGARELRLQRMEILRAWVTAAARLQPVLLVFEDLQWIDPTSLELLELLIDHVQDAAILIIVTHRTSDASNEEYAKPNKDLTDWRAIPNVATYTVDELSSDEAAKLISEIAGTHSVPRDVIDAISRRALGNPLYIQELTRAWLETNSSDTITSAPGHQDDPSILRIPTSLSSALMERIDQLGPAREATLHAAIIGNEFSIDLLKRISLQPEADITMSLRMLERLGIMKLVTGAPESTYRFSHALLQTAAYGSLLTNRRKDLHRQVAIALEQDRAANLDVSIELIAQHFARDHSAEKAIRLWQEAAEQAAAKSAHHEAARLLDNALDVLPELPDSPKRLGLELDLTAASAATLRSLHGYAAPIVEARYLRAQALCEQIDAPLMRFYVNWGLFQCNIVKEDLSYADAIAERLMSSANEHSASMRADANLAMGMCHLLQSEFSSARQFLELATSLTDPATDQPNRLTHGQNTGIFAQSNLAHTLAFLGFAERARQISDENVQIARRRMEEPTHLYSLINALTFAARVFLLFREPEVVNQLSIELLQLATRHRYAYYEAIANAQLGWATAENGELAAGISAMRSAMTALQETGTRLATRGFWVQLAGFEFHSGNHAEARRILEDLSDRKGASGWAPEIYRLLGCLAEHQGEETRQQAEHWFRKSIETARHQEGRTLELRATISLALHLRTAGRSREACTLLSDCVARCPTLDKTRDMDQAQAFIREWEG